MAVSLWLSLDEPPSAALYAVFIALLVVIQLRQDAINAFSPIGARFPDAR